MTSDGLVKLGIGFCFNEVCKAFNISEIHFFIEERPSRKFTRLCSSKALK